MARARSFVDSTQHSAFGGWDSVVIRAYKDDPTPDVDYNLGACRDGALSLSRSFVEIQSTTFPQVVERLVPSGSAMSFSGSALELRSQQVMNYLTGGSIEDTDELVPFGADCGSAFVHGVIMQSKPCNDDNQVIESVIWSGHVSGDMEIGSAEGERSMAFEIQALNDANGTYGGSASAPLGTIYVPDSGVSMAVGSLVTRLGIDA